MPESCECSSIEIFIVWVINVCLVFLKKSRMPKQKIPCYLSILPRQCLIWEVRVLPKNEAKVCCHILLHRFVQKSFEKNNIAQGTCCSWNGYWYKFFGLFFRIFQSDQMDISSVIVPNKPGKRGVGYFPETRIFLK